MLIQPEGFPPMLVSFTPSTGALSYLAKLLLKKKKLVTTDIIKKIEKTKQPRLAEGPFQSVLQN